MWLKEVLLRSANKQGILGPLLVELKSVRHMKTTRNTPLRWLSIARCLQNIQSSTVHLISSSNAQQWQDEGQAGWEI
jgi:hypothetical protein